MTINSDLGGVGVYIAYLMQLSLTSIAFLLCIPLKFFRSQVSSVISIILCKLKGLPASSHKGRRTKRQISKVLRSKFKVLISMCIDLQETQCFFLLASLTATLIALRNQSPVLLSATNYAQLQNNELFLTLIGTCGLVPVSMVNCIMIVGNNWSIEIGALGIITSIVSVVVTINIFSEFLAITPDFPPKSGLASTFTTPNVNRLDKCGYNPSPFVYCSLPTSNLNIHFMSLICLCFSVAISCICTITPFIYRVISYLKSPVKNGRHSLHTPSKKLSNVEEKRLKKKVDKNLCRVHEELGLLFFLPFIGMTFYMFILLDGLGAVSMDSWSIDQIISIWAFVPVIWKSVYASSAGLIRHFRIRIPWPYEITKELESDEEKDDDTDDESENNNHDGIETDPQRVVSGALDNKEEDDSKQLTLQENAEVHQGQSEDSSSDCFKVSPSRNLEEV